MIVFGGYNCANYLNDVWVLNNIGSATPTYAQLSPIGGPPPARNLHSAVYDPTGNRLELNDPNPPSWLEGV